MKLLQSPGASTLAGWRRQIDTRGSKSISRRELLRVFGCSKQTTERLRAIEQWLKEQRPPLFVTLRPVAPPDELVTLTSYERTIGEPEQSELALERRFESEMMGRLGLSRPKPQYPPRGASDRIDVCCLDAEKRWVAVELKLRDGKKRAVEQLLRYIGHLRHEGRRQPRGILITGEADPYTWRALQGLERNDLIEWWLYGILEGGVLALKRREISQPPPKPAVNDIKLQQERLLREFAAERRVKEKAEG